MLRWLRLLRCSLVAVLLFPVLLPVLLAELSLALALAELMMIRCSGLLTELWMFWPGLPGRRRSWRR